MEAAEDGLMLRVTWEWLGFDAALDLANTVAVSNDVDHDLLAPEGEYERWAVAAAKSSALALDEASAIATARSQLLELREAIREVLRATAAGEPLRHGAVAALNRASRAAPEWPELCPHGDVRARARGSALERLMGAYARSAIDRRRR